MTNQVTALHRGGGQAAARAPRTMGNLLRRKHCNQCNQSHRTQRCRGDDTHHDHAKSRHFNTLVPWKICYVPEAGIPYTEEST
jgi:hypothetical protein